MHQIDLVHPYKIEELIANDATLYLNTLESGCADCLF